MGARKTRVENAGLENPTPDDMGGKRSAVRGGDGALPK